jgi:hypothetical protein
MKRELIMVATMITRTIGTFAFSAPTEFSIRTERKRARFRDTRQKEAG